MTTHEIHDTGAVGEIEGLERKVAELRYARAQLHAERDEHLRNVARAATMRDGLAQLHRELKLLAGERDGAREIAKRDCDEAVADLERIAHATRETAAEVETVAARLAEARARHATLEEERPLAERRVADAEAAESLAREQNEETQRTARDLRAKLDAAAAETALAEARSVQFVEIAQTLDREQATAETQLATIRSQYETARLEADLARIRGLESQLASERAELERRLSDITSNVERDEYGASRMAGHTTTPGFDSNARTIVRITLAQRLQRDFGGAA
jgi:chromosome segregation protein